MKNPEAAKPASKANYGISHELMLEAGRILEANPSWVIFSHTKLDGDAIGSAGALFESGLIKCKRVRWFGVDPVPPNYHFLPHVKEYVTQKKYRFDSEDDIYIFLDSANEERSVKGLKERSPGTVVLNIDHHEDNTRFGTLNCVDSEASSTSELLWRIMTAVNWPITQTIAECLYIGAAADTGWFAFGNTTSITHSMAADLLNRGVDSSKIDSCVRHNRSIESMRLWGLAFMRVFRWGKSSQFAMTWLTHRDFAATNAIPADTATLVNQMLTIRGVRFAVLLTEDDDSGLVKGNFRSKDGVVSAASVAQALGGGGHPKASGAYLAPPMADAIQIVQKTVDKLYAEWAIADK